MLLRSWASICKNILDQEHIDIMEEYYLIQYQIIIFASQSLLTLYRRLKKIVELNFIMHIKCTVQWL